MNKTFNNLIESILEAGYKSPASLSETDWDDPTEQYWNRSKIDVPDSCTINVWNDNRQLKKDKIVKRKEQIIKNNQDNLNRWLDLMASKENISLIAIETERYKLQRKINKKKEELEMIKKLPLSDKMFD